MKPGLRAGRGDGEGGRFGGRLRDARLDRRRRVSPRRAGPRCAGPPAGDRRSCCLSRSTSSRWATVPFPGEPPKKAATTVTLALTSEQVDLVELVEGRGDLSLVLRSRDDRRRAAQSFKRTEVERLLGLNVPPSPPQFTADIFRRAQKQTIAFARPISSAAKPKP